MFRFVFVLCFYFYLTIYVTIAAGVYAKKYKNQPDVRFAKVKKLCSIIVKRSRVKVVVTGKENLPKDTGYVMFSNHQGKFDTLAVITSAEERLSVVIRKDKSTQPIIKQFIDLLGGKRLNVNNLRESVTLFNDVKQEIYDGTNYLIFPEGTHNNNKNNLLEFKTGCFHFLRNSNIPIVPVVLFDTYKVYNTNSLKKVTCSVNYLKPIEPSEYANLSKQELASLIKSRIQEKLDEIKLQNAVE